MWHPMQANETLGFEREGTLLRGALVRYRKKAPLIEQYFTIHTEEQTLPLSKTVLNRALIVTGLSSEETLIRPLEVKLTKQADVDTVLAFQAEPLLPYPVEQAYIDRWVLGKTEDATQVSVLAVRKDVLQSHLKWYEDTLHLDPERVSTVSSALALFAHWYAPSKELLLILHMGRENAVFLLAEEGKVLAAQGLPASVTSLWNPPSTSSATPQPSNVLESLRQTLVRLLFAFTKQVKGRTISSILFTGEGSTNNSLLPTIAEWLEKEPIALLVQAPADRSMLLTYAIPVGLACGAFPDARNGDPIQLRQGEDAYKYPLKRLRKPLIAFTVASLLCALALYCWNAIALQARKQHLDAEYSALLTQMHRSHEDVEAQFEGKAVTSKPAPCIPLDQLSPLAISRRLAFLEKENAQGPDIFPLQPNILRVSDLLAWLSSHPKSVQVDPTTGKTIPLFQITSFNYQMTKRPDRNKSTEHYQVKVDLELQSSDSKGPRELYDALLQQNEVVDSTNPVTWSSGQGKYRISFYLKDHTIYP